MFDIRSLTWDEWSYPEGVILPIVTLGLSDPRIGELREMPQSFIIKLYSETQVSGRLGMSGGISPRHAQNPLSGERRKTLSITHHALSPPPSHHHLYIIHLINWLQRFYRIIMSLKRPFVPKSDVKQWFTTTIVKFAFGGNQLIGSKTSWSSKNRVTFSHNLVSYAVFDGLTLCRRACQRTARLYGLSESELRHVRSRWVLRLKWREKYQGRTTLLCVRTSPRYENEAVIPVSPRPGIWG